MSAQKSQKELISIAYKFYENLYALRVFNEQIGQFAEEYDESTKDRFFTGLAELAGIPKDVIDINGDTPFELHFKHRRQDQDLLLLELHNKESDNVESERDNVRQKDVQNRTEVGLDSENSINKQEDIQDLAGQDKKIIEIEIADGNHFVKILKFMRSIKKYDTRQSKLLRQGALISLVSYFEALEVDLLQCFYLTYPDALPSEGKLLSLADLREIGSIDEAEWILITKEIDTLLRDNTETQIEYFTKRPKVDLNCINPYVEDLLEIVQRRNLYVHNNGIVNKIYINKVRKEAIEQNDLHEGDELKVDSEYLSMAIDAVCICGTILIQQSWRKWNANQTELADTVLREYTYDLLIEKRWDLVDKLSVYATGLHFSSDSDARIIIINQAIALKEQNKLAEMEKLLNQKDWSACAMKFHVALYALKDEYDAMMPLLHKAIAADEIDKQAISEWPLFKWFRESNHYIPFINKVFPP